MIYDYKIVDADPNKRFVKRVALYIALLFLIVSFALVILFVLFQRYLSLMLPAALTLVSTIIWFTVGRKAEKYEYFFTENLLEIKENDRVLMRFAFSEIDEERNAEKSDFFDKSIIKFTFIESRIIMKNAINDNNIMLKTMVVTMKQKEYLLAFDEYALALLGGKK